MKAAPIHDVFTANGTVREDGRVIYDRYLMKVKTPAESKYPWDYLTVVAKIPAAEAFRPLGAAAARWRGPERRSTLRLSLNGRWKSSRRRAQRREGLLHGRGGNAEQPRIGLAELQIRKIALATANEPRPSAAALVPLRPESTPKPQNSNIAQDTTMTSSGHEIGLASCSDVSRRVCWKAEELAIIDDNDCVCAGVCGLSQEIVSFHFSNLGM